MVSRRKISSSSAIRRMTSHPRSIMGSERSAWRPAATPSISFEIVARKWCSRTSRTGRARRLSLRAGPDRFFVEALDRGVDLRDRGHSRAHQRAQECFPLFDFLGQLINRDACPGGERFAILSPWQYLKRIAVSVPGRDAVYR